MPKINFNSLRRVKLADTLGFDCQRCDSCCTGDIMLTPLDLFKISCFLGVSERDIGGKVCRIMAHGHIHLPMLHLNGEPVCIFRHPDGCIINHIKPFVCRLYPLGRGYDEPIPNGISKLFGKTFYYVQPVPCPGLKADKQTPVTAFVEDGLATTVSDSLSELIELLFPIPIPVLNDGVLTTIINLLYYDYDHDSAFLPQFEKRVASVKTYIRQL